ncbi:unnamed protein product [Dibothriocephalus latus]|uniref:Uncharacterized protein n=1 Tax=Dibothriocephalus latus TaxID=60516 RepID=A0A3P6TNM4_DIBLA|nr:unnamed protein product [Dibothriocephalus latus]
MIGSKATLLGGQTNRSLADWVLASALPGQYIKETEKARKYKSDFEKEISALSLDYAKLIAQKEKLEAQLLALITENEACRAAAADGKRQTGRNKELTEEAVNRYNSWNDLEMASRMDKAKLLQRIETCFQEKKELAEIQTKIKWEKDNLLKSLKKSTMQLEVLTESVKNIQTVYDKVRARYAVTPKYDTTLGARKDKLTDLVRTLQQDIGEEVSLLFHGRGALNLCYCLDKLDMNI